MMPKDDFRPSILSMQESQTRIAQEVLASSYGIQGATICPIGYGLINWLARVDNRGQSYELKRYTPRTLSPISSRDPWTPRTNALPVECPFGRLGCGYAERRRLAS